MADMIDLLGEVSPSLKVGWLLWCSSGLALGWFGLVRATRVTAAPPPATVPRVALSSLHKEPWDLRAAPVIVPPATITAVSEPTFAHLDPPTRKARRRRRTSD